MEILPEKEGERTKGHRRQELVTLAKDSIVDKVQGWVRDGWEEAERMTVGWNRSKNK